MTNRQHSRLPTDDYDDPSLPGTHIGVRGQNRLDRDEPVFSLVAGLQGVVGFDSPELADVSRNNPLGFTDPMGLQSHDERERFRSMWRRGGLPVLPDATVDRFIGGFIFTPLPELDPEGATLAGGQLRSKVETALVLGHPLSLFDESHPIWQYIGPGGEQRVKVDLSAMIIAHQEHQSGVEFSKKFGTMIGDPSASNRASFYVILEEHALEALPFLPKLRGWTFARAGSETAAVEGRVVGTVDLELEAGLTRAGMSDEAILNLRAAGYEMRAAAEISKKGVFKQFGLPTSGRIRFVPDKAWHATEPLPRGPQYGFSDKFGNEWVWNAQAGHWDVQLSSTGKAQLGWLSSSGEHVNVTPAGEVPH